MMKKQKIIEFFCSVIVMRKITFMSTMLDMIPQQRNGKLDKVFFLGKACYPHKNFQALYRVIMLLMILYVSLLLLNYFYIPITEEC